MSSDKAVSSRILRKLDVQDVLCPICREIYIEPVSLPCHHVVCLQCLEKTVENNSLVCPICRKRIGTFLRLAKNLKKIVNQTFWEEVKTQFPNEIKRKQNGEDDGISKKFTENQPHAVESTVKGSIKQEFEELIHKLKIEEERSKLAQQTASEILAKKFVEEELENERRRKQIDKEIAEADALYIKNLLLSEKMKPNSIVSTSTNSSSSPIDEEPNCENGRDSISIEFRHFTPICIVPKTPPKVLPNGEKRDIKIFQPKNLGISLDTSKMNHSRSLQNKTTLKICSNNFSRTKQFVPEPTGTYYEEMDQDSGHSDNSNDSHLSEKIPFDLIRVQKEIQKKIQQEQEDLSLALKLQAKWSKEKSPNKRKHGYTLRSGKKNKNKK